MMKHTPKNLFTIIVLVLLASSCSNSYQKLAANYQINKASTGPNYSDVAYWEAAGIAYIETPTFDSISDDSFQMGLSWVASADVTVLCDFPIGTANAKNLALASSSKNVIVMTTHSEQERFFQPAVQTEYDAIVARSPMVEIDQLLSAINAITKNQ